MNCIYAKQLFSPAIDGYLTEFEQANFYAHLKECHDCQKEFEILKKISFHLKELSNLEYTVPEGFTGQVMESLKKTQRSRFVVPIIWKTGIAAVATAVIIAGSTFGLSGVTKMAMKSKLALNGIPETKVLEQLQVAPEVQPEGVAADHQKGDTVPDKTVETNETDKITTDVGMPVEPKVKTDPTQKNVLITPPAVLLNKDIKITSTLLKISTTVPSEAKNKALNIASAGGAIYQVYNEQLTDDKRIQFIRLSISTDRAPGLISELSSLGTVISKQDENRNVTAKYNEATSQYQELVARINAGGDQNIQALAEQADALKQQLDNWNEESKNHAIILWIESPKNQ